MNPKVWAGEGNRGGLTIFPYKELPKEGVEL